jgi:hypothetical protein
MQQRPQDFTLKAQSLCYDYTGWAERLTGLLGSHMVQNAIERRHSDSCQQRFLPGPMRGQQADAMACALIVQCLDDDMLPFANGKDTGRIA